MKLSTCIYQFFDQYLPHIKGSSQQTLKTYRDTFTLFLPFAAKYLSIKIESLRLEHLSADLILAFLNYLESDRNNAASTRNHRLAAIKSLAKMIRFMYPDKRKIAETILSIPQKRAQKQLIGFLYPDEILNVFESVDLNKKEGFRNYTILHLLYDSGARASEVAALNLDYFDPQNSTLAILGKGNRYRLIELWPKTTALIKRYIAKYRTKPKLLYQHRLFINQRGIEFTRHGIYRLCRKYLTKTLSPKRLKHINPAHSFRHSCAIRMLSSAEPISNIKNRLGHENVQSTMVYLQLDLARRRKVQNKFIEYTQANLSYDPKIEELMDWENKEEILTWLDSL
ncbi:MAG: tyrosine-type recombinase/integrase [Deltaproteobacteria bacterium]|nr:tyrosine-type recombinase/integrase [Candidatus Desulfobacula maris]